jgi:myo-inositol-1(or 4)-monophosphatase
MLQRPDPSELLALAVDVAREAGGLLTSGRHGRVEIVAIKSSQADVATALDRRSEELIGCRLREERPGDGLLGEEGADECGTTGVRWIVDPLDGTTNFLYRLPNWAVSIAAEVDGQIVAGVVHAPALGLTYTAALGFGAFCGSARLSGSGQTDLSAALVATGFGYSAARRTSQAAVVSRVLRRVRDIRIMGAAALDLCAAAEGIVDAYYERGLGPWDHAAGCLIAQEAGLRVAGLRGSPASEALVAVAPPTLFDPLVELLSQNPPADRD